MMTDWREKGLRSFMVAGMILVVIVAYLGGDPAPIAETWAKVLLWLLPGLFLGAIAMAIAKALQQDLHASLGIGVSVSALYFVIRALLWMGSR